MYTWLPSENHLKEFSSAARILLRKLLAVVIDNYTMRARLEAFLGGILCAIRFRSQGSSEFYVRAAVEDIDGEFVDNGVKQQGTRDDECSRCVVQPSGRQVAPRRHKNAKIRNETPCRDAPRLRNCRNFMRT